MIKVTKAKRGSLLEISLVGSLEETLDLERLVGQLPQGLEVNCKGITRINSAGAKAWVSYFQSLQKQGIRVKFVECSTAVVDLMNFIVNFSCGGEVESIYLPFSCKKCKLALLGLFRVDFLKKHLGKRPTMECTQCSGSAEFDDLQDEYLSFLTK